MSIKRPLDNHSEETNKRLAQHDSDHLWRAALLSWVAEVNVADQLTSALNPEAFLQVKNLIKTTGQWMYLEKALISDKVAQYITADQVVPLQRLSHHWNRAIKASTCLPGVVLYIDKVVKEFKEYKAQEENKGKSKREQAFFLVHQHKFENASQWVIKAASPTDWHSFTTVVPEMKVLLTRVTSFTAHFNGRNEWKVVTMIRSMTSLKHLSLHPEFASHNGLSSFLIKRKLELETLVVVPVKTGNSLIRTLRFDDLSHFTDISSLRTLVLGFYDVQAITLYEMIKKAPLLSRVNVAGTVNVWGRVSTRPLWVTRYMTGTVHFGHDELIVFNIHQPGVGETRWVDTRHNAWDFDTVMKKIGV